MATFSPTDWQQEKREQRMAALGENGQLSRLWRYEHPGYSFHRFDPRAAKVRADEREKNAVYAAKGPPRP